LITIARLTVLVLKQGIERPNRRMEFVCFAVTGIASVHASGLRMELAY
jgi:hypothetical protein